MKMHRALNLVLMAAMFSASPAFADKIGFNDWKQHWFTRFADVDFDGSAQSLKVKANDAVSIIHKPLKPSQWATKTAQWDWSVAQSVPATDLRNKGGDDRNLSLYFAFLPQDEAKKAKDSSLRKLLQNPDGRVLVYVWGGDHKRGAFLESPYLGVRGKTIVLRPSGTGSHHEKIDLIKDYRRAFKTDPGALVALAISADSDDTGTIAQGAFSSLSLAQ